MKFIKLDLLQIHLFCATIFSQVAQSVPEGDEWESKKETEGASKLRDQGRDRVDQLLRLNVGLVRDGPEGEHEVVWFERWWIRFSQDTVLPVLARLCAAGSLTDFIWVGISQLVEYLIVSPAEFMVIGL